MKIGKRKDVKMFIGPVRDGFAGVGAAQIFRGLSVGSSQAWSFLQSDNWTVDTVIIFEVNGGPCTK